MNNKDLQLSRRGFLVKSFSAISVVYVIPNLFTHAEAAKPLDQKVSSSTKWAMAVDVDKCVSGCTACVDACICLLYTSDAADE